MELAEAAGQQERKSVAELQTELVGFKDRIRVAEGELAKNAPLIAQLNHANQNMGNRVGAVGCRQGFCMAKALCPVPACGQDCVQSQAACACVHGQSCVRLGKAVTV